MRMDTEEERMRAAENVLESYGVHELRRYARELGVPRPTQRKKAELIGEIVQAAFHGGERRIGRKGARCKARPHSQEELERFRQLVCGGPAGGAGGAGRTVRVCGTLEIAEGKVVLSLREI